jgi:hypothetical protein
MFVAIGHTPNTKFLAGQSTGSTKGFICLNRSIPNNDKRRRRVRRRGRADPIYKQAVTAAGMGCKAALDAERWLAARGFTDLSVHVLLDSDKNSDTDSGRAVKPAAAAQCAARPRLTQCPPQATIQRMRRAACPGE